MGPLLMYPYVHSGRWEKGGLGLDIGTSEAIPRPFATGWGGCGGVTKLK